MLLHQEVSEYDLCLQLYSLQPDVEASRQNYFFTFHINVFKKKQETTTTIRKIIMLRFKGIVYVISSNPHPPIFRLACLIHQTVP